MFLIDYLKRARQGTLDRYSAADNAKVHLYSGTAYSFWRAARGPTRENAKGLVLDAGSGRGGWRSLIESTAARREALDIEARLGDKLDWVANLESMPDVPSERFDAVICHQVLEHVPHPAKALGEIHRVLKPDGRLVVSVPHLSRLHDLPHDYYRYTPAGLRVLLDEAGFDIIESRTWGGLLTFLHHQFSTVFLGLASRLGPLYYPALALNAPFAVLTAVLDAIVDRGRLLPNGLLVVAKKAAGPEHRELDR